MPAPIDLWLTLALGFLGSFGHCVGMCGPLTAAFALSVQPREKSDSPAAKQQFQFHLLLNVGRLLSYVIVGAGIGALGSVILAGGQAAGVGSALRRTVSMLTGLLLIWFGFTQAQPGFLPSLPFLHVGQRLHEWVSKTMMRISAQQQVLAPLLLGLLWGLIPCGFLYTGQLRAAATQSWSGGAAVMLAFGLGTLPAMLVTGVATAWLSRDRRTQLFRCGGWVTIVIGALLLIRTGSTMSDYSGHAALICLVLALLARPISRLWQGPLRYRRVLGVGAFVLALLHVLHMMSHTWNWQWEAIQFMLPAHQVGVWLGITALLLMAPAAFTSFDRAQKALGTRWRKLHLLGVPALLLAAVHTIITGSHYWGALALTWRNHMQVAAVVLVVVVTYLVRSPFVWNALSLQTRYASPTHLSSASNAQAIASRDSVSGPPSNSDASCCQRDVPS